MKGIYGYLDLKTCLVDYIGKDSNIDKKIRHNDHVAPSKYNKQPFNKILQRNIDRYQYFVFEEGDFTDDELNELEIDYIKIHKPRFNFTEGGDGVTGHKWGDERKEKFSARQKENSFRNYLKRAKSVSKTGIYRVSIKKCKKGNNTFSYWQYRWQDADGKRKSIIAKTIPLLKEKVKARGLLWFRFDEVTVL